MSDDKRPLVISAPAPRTLDLIFSDEARPALHAGYRIVEADAEDIARLPDEELRGEARYIIGQPPLSEATLVRLQNLRCVLNVESNLFNNMPYEILFQRG